MGQFGETGLSSRGHWTETIGSREKQGKRYPIGADSTSSVSFCFKIHITSQTHVNTHLGLTAFRSGHCTLTILETQVMTQGPTMGGFPPLAPPAVTQGLSIHAEREALIRFQTARKESIPGHGARPVRLPRFLRALVYRSGDSQGTVINTAAVRPQGTPCCLVQSRRASPFLANQARSLCKD